MHPSRRESIGGEQRQPAYRAKNPQGLVPALEVGGAVFGQSMAIFEHLEETHPEPPLLPRDPVERARVRALANLVACDMHPLNNLRVQIYLARNLACSEDQVLTWYRHWVAEGFAGIEPQLAETAGECCFGDAITMADLCLVPQVFNARRFDCGLSPDPTIVEIDARLAGHPAFAAACLTARIRSRPASASRTADCFASLGGEVGRRATPAFTPCRLCALLLGALDQIGPPSGGVLV